MSDFDMEAAFGVSSTMAPLQEEPRPAKEENAIPQALDSFDMDAAFETVDPAPSALAIKVRENLALSLGSNPDQEAAMRKTARQTGAPVSAVRTYPEEAHQQAALDHIEAQELPERFPSTAWFLSKLQHAQIAHDDVDNLTQIEVAIRAGEDRVPNLVEDAAALHDSGESFSTKTYRMRLVERLRLIAGWSNGSENIPFMQPEDAVPKHSVWYELATQPGQGFWDTFAAGFAPDLTGPASTGLGKVARSAGALGGFIVGAPLKFAQGIVAGVRMLETMATDSVAKALLKDVVRQSSTLALASGLTATGRMLDANTPAQALATVGHAAAGGAQLGMVFGVAGRLLPDATLAQFAGRALGINLAIDSLNGTSPFDSRSLEEKVFDYGLNTFFSLRGAGHVQGGWFHDAVRADIAQQDAANLQHLLKEAVASKVRHRDPDAFKQFIDQARTDSPLQQVYIDADALMQVLAQAQMDSQAFASLLPEVAGQLPEAQITSGMVRIPLQDLVTHVAGTNLEPFLLPHLRTDPEGMTPYEAQAFVQKHPDQFEQEAAQLGQRQPDNTRIHSPDFPTELENANLSTFLQQSSPLFLNTAQGPASKRFAQGFERWLFEGEAADAQEQHPFADFRDWLLRQYRAQRNGPIALSPEVRRVLELLHSSEEALKTTQAAQSQAPLFTTQETSGLSEEAWHAYQALGEAATAEAMQILQKRSLRDVQWLSRAKSDVLKTLQQQANVQRQHIQAEVEAELSVQPVYRAQQFLEHGTLEWKEVPHLLQNGDAQNTKLSITLLKQQYGNHPDALWRTLPTGKHGWVAAKGLDPDFVAELTGFASGDALVRALSVASPWREAVLTLTDQRMLARYGELVDPQALSRAADEAVHSDLRARILATELAALDHAVGPWQQLTRTAKEAAHRTIAHQRIRDIQPSLYTVVEARAGREAKAAFASGDIAEAAKAKRTQLLNHHLAKASLEARSEIQKIRRYLSRFGKKSTHKALDAEYHAQINALLERHDLRISITHRALARRQSLQNWVEAQLKQGYQPAIPERLLEDAARTHYKDLLLEDFRGLSDAIHSIEHLGRLKQKLLDARKERDFNTAVDEALAQSASLPPRTIPTPRNPGESGSGLDKVQGYFLRAKSSLRSADASLLKMEQVLSWLDNHSPNGLFHRIVFQPISDAGVRENDLRITITQRLRTLAKTLPKESQRDFGQRYTLPELIDTRTGKPSSLLKSELLAIALNTGNDSNFKKMLEGEQWSVEGVEAALHRHMGQADWDFVQGVWDTLESLWPQIEALEKRLSGVAPPKVEAREVVTPYGTYRGGYYPVIYDPLRSFDVEQNRQRNADQLFEENNYRRASTPKGHTIARKEYAAPLYLSLSVLPRHLSQVIHDIAYREAVINADRFLADSRIRTRIENTLGHEYYAQFRPWLQSIANDRVVDARGLAFWDRMAHWTRTSATMVGLGFRLSTMLIHGASAASNSVGELGVRWMRSGMQAFFGSPQKMKGAYDFVTTRSGEMRHRMGEVDRDIREALREMELASEFGPLGALQRLNHAVKRTAYYGIAMLDMASALPTWLGAYNRALHEGLAEESAIYAADHAVRNAHGGAGIKDMAAIQRGSEFQKLFTMFYSFWNHFYNRQRDIARRAASILGSLREGKYEKAREDFSLVLARSWFYFVVPQLIHAALKPSYRNEEDEEHWAHWAAEELALGMFSGIPVARDIAGSVLGGRSYVATPAAQMVVTTLRSAKDLSHLMHDEDVSDTWRQHALQTAGYVFGLPTGQAAQTGLYLWDVMQGEEDPQDLADWWRGVVYGRGRD